MDDPALVVAAQVSALHAAVKALIAVHPEKSEVRRLYDALIERYLKKHPIWKDDEGARQMAKQSGANLFDAP